VWSGDIRWLVSLASWTARCDNSADSCWSAWTLPSCKSSSTTFTLRLKVRFHVRPTKLCASGWYNCLICTCLDFLHHLSRWLIKSVKCPSVRPSGVSIFKTPRLDDRKVDVDQTWRMCSMGLGIFFGPLPRGSAGEMTYPDWNGIVVFNVPLETL